jgi:hypothetical protein
MPSRKIHGAKIQIHIMACNWRDRRDRTSRSRRNRETRPQLRLASVPPPFIAEGDWANDTDLGKTFRKTHKSSTSRSESFSRHCGIRALTLRGGLVSGCWGSSFALSLTRA